MGDEDDAAPTQAAPTELSKASDSLTEASMAWSLEDEEEDPSRRLLTPGRITTLAVAGSVLLIAAVATVGYQYLRDREDRAPSGQAPSTSTVTAAPPPTVTVTQPPPPPAVAPPRSRAPSPSTIPMDPYGQAHVRTVSGQTVCALTAGDVQCNVHFTNRLGPSYNGMPVSGVGVTSRGEWQWLYGDPGDPEYVTMSYGTIYHAIGWTITPSTEGTTFMYDATGHGMTISTAGFSPF
jgi:hypothetical protein